MLVRENELRHHGIKGMKWGVRRYQNKDGSLTSKGKKHSKTKHFMRLSISMIKMCIVKFFLIKNNSR